LRSFRLEDVEARRWISSLRDSAIEDPAIRDRVSEVLRKVRTDGDAAVRAYTTQFDGVELESTRLTDSALRKLAEACPAPLRSTLEAAAENIRAFHAPQKPSGYSLSAGRLKQRIVPLAAVGLYVPGGRASYPSTVLMNVIPARIAGVERIVVVTPPQKRANIVSPAVAAACLIAGATEVYLMGGAQAVAALTFGTATVARVDKICGPGNAYVTEAKRQVIGRVGIDMLAGPSEVLVLDDGRGRPDRIARDLLAQAEHDPLAVPLCVTTSEKTWQLLPGSVETILSSEPNPIAAESMKNRGAVLLAKTLEEAVAFANEFAPEHLELETDPSVADRIRNAGALFVGEWTPEPVGDYFAGPNHTLPTAGSARFSSALGVNDFVKRVHEIHWTAQDLARSGEAIAGFARAEGLVAHARSVEVRLEEAAKAEGSAGIQPELFVLPSVQRQKAYTLLAPPEAPVKLNQNEAPEDLPASVKAALIEKFKAADWRRYPPFDPIDLRQRIAHLDGWRPEGVLIGNGSNELLTLLIRSVVGPGDTVVRTDPCFSLYPLHLDVAGAVQKTLVLREDEDFAFRDDELVQLARSAKVVLIATPNNPTGSVLRRETVERLLGIGTALIVIDEAYREWCGQDFAPLLGENVPLVLLRTASKAQAMAALRFGYLLGPTALCQELHKVILPYSVNTLTQIAALQLLEDESLVKPRLESVKAERERMVQTLRGKGRRVVDGGANFILFSSPNPSAEFERLLKGGVLVRDLSKAVPGFLRVSMGTRPDNDRLLEML
jgi:histidinol dehydrogenase